MIDLDKIGMMPCEIQKEIARKEKQRRKADGISQAEMARRTGMSLSSVRRFEQTGEISFSSLIKIAGVLYDEDAFLHLFEPKEFRTMKELIDAQRKKR